MIGFIRTPYEVNEIDYTATIVIGVINGTLQSELTVGLALLIELEGTAIGNLNRYQ